MNPRFITVHCSATQNTPSVTVEKIKDWHVRKNKWSDIGYHFVIETDGSVKEGRPLNVTGAHVQGHNKDNIGICLIGGLNRKGETENNFTINQKMSLVQLVHYLNMEYNIGKEGIKGHRDWFEDINGDGVIDSRDWLKECPVFDVIPWVMKHIRYFH